MLLTNCFLFSRVNGKKISKPYQNLEGFGCLQFPVLISRNKLCLLKAIIWILNACILSQANILMLSFGEIAKQKKAIRTTKKMHPHTKGKQKRTVRSKGEKVLIPLTAK